MLGKRPTLTITLRVASLETTLRIYPLGFIALGVLTTLAVTVVTLL